MSLTKDQILGAEDTKREKVNIPEWGGFVYVGMMDGETRDRWEVGLIADKTEDRKSNLYNIRARLAILVTQDEEGKPIFSASDAERLGKKSAKALDRIFAVAKKLNKIGDDDIEELAKN